MLDFSNQTDNSHSNICSNTETNSTDHTSKERCYENPNRSVKKSYVWKYFVKKDNPSRFGKIMICTLNL